MSSKVIELTEIEQLAQFFANWQGQIDQVSRGRFEGMLRVVEGNTVRVAAVAFNQRVAFRGRDSSGQIAVYPVIDRRSTNSWLGCQLRPCQIVVGGPGHEINHCSPKQTLDWSVHLRAEVLTDAAHLLRNADVLALPHNSVVYSAPPDAVAELMRQVNRMLNMGLVDPAFPEVPECHSLERECIRALVAALAWPADPPQRLPISTRSQVVSRAEEFLRARLSDPVPMIDLCGAIGANDRTLRLAFQERFGVGPMTYFKLLRLNAVRSRLRKDPKVSIREAAEEFGFRHQGNFAADYRRTFGESPSETNRSPLPW